MNLKYMCLGVVVVILTGCGAPGAATSPGPSPPTAANTARPSQPASSSTISGATPATGVGVDLSDTTWQLVAYGPKATPTSATTTPATISFEQAGRVRGSGGCNEYGGTYTIRAGELSFRDIVSTQKACTDASVMQQEMAVLGTLADTVRVDLIGDESHIAANDTNVLIFTRQ